MRKATDAFTFIELLLVVAILGIIAIISIPFIEPLLSGGNLRMGAREFAAACKYARSMALLNQTPVDVTFNQGGNEVSITAREITEASGLGMSDLAAVTNDVGYTESLAGASARRRASLSGGFGVAMSRDDREDAEFKMRGNGSDLAAVSPMLDADGAEIAETVSFADSINASRKSDGVKFFFEEFTDRMETRSAWSKISGGPTTFDDGDTLTIRFRANGTVRPCKIRVESDKNEDDYMTVFINPVGAVRVAATREEEEE